MPWCKSFHQGDEQCSDSARSQVASACFIQPPLCYVGLTEEEAVERLSGDIDVFVSKFKPLKNTLSGRDEKTLMKMIVHVDTDEVWAKTVLCDLCTGQTPTALRLDK